MTAARARDPRRRRRADPRARPHRERRGRPGRHRLRDQRGSISMFVVIFTIAVLMLAGLVYDGGLAIAARQRAADIAEEAARAGANAVDVDALRAGEPLRLDEAQACANADELVRRDGDGSLKACFVDLVDPSVLHVRVHVTVQPVLLTLFHFPAFQAVADASSNPLQQE